jgi:glycosyltransferase involved in cell wall biosynthesis
MIRALPDLIRHREKTCLLVVGGSLFTDYITELRQLASELRLSDRVIFTGTKPYRDLPRYIACMDVCTIPLSPPRWGEIALPNKYFEYSACGKPILMRPIPDVLRIGGPNLFMYTTREEFITQAKNLMDRPVTYRINLDAYSWKEKSRQFEIELRKVL